MRGNSTTTTWCVSYADRAEQSASVAVIHTRSFSQLHGSHLKQAGQPAASACLSTFSDYATSRLVHEKEESEHYAVEEVDDVTFHVTRESKTHVVKYVGGILTCYIPLRGVYIVIVKLELRE